MADEEEMNFERSNHSRSCKVPVNLFTSSFTVGLWVLEFKHCRAHRNDVLRSGHPETTTTPDIIDKIHDMEAFTDSIGKMLTIDKFPNRLQTLS